MSDKIDLENTSCVSKSLLFCGWFNFSSDQHNYETSWSSHAKLKKASYRTNMYDKNSIKDSAMESWNKTQNQLKYVFLKLLLPIMITIIITTTITIINYYY